MSSGKIEIMILVFLFRLKQGAFVLYIFLWQCGLISVGIFVNVISIKFYSFTFYETYFIQIFNVSMTLVVKYLVCECYRN